MNQVVYKYPLAVDLGEVTSVELPVPAKPVLFGRDMNGVVCVWVEHAKVVDQAVVAQAKFRVVATGAEFDPTHTPRHAGSFNDIGFIWHLYTNLAW